MNSILEISDKKPFYGGLCGPGLRKAVAAIIRRAGLVHSGESCLTESSQVVGSKQPLRRFCGGKACLGFSLPQTPLMWEPPALGLPFFFTAVATLPIFTKIILGYPNTYILGIDYWKTGGDTLRLLWQRCPNMGKSQL